MPKEDAEAKLKELDRRLQEGWNNLHSIKESHLEAVREVVREQWQEQQRSAAEQKAAPSRKSKSRNQDQSKRPSQDKDHGRNH